MQGITSVRGGARASAYGGTCDVVAVVTEEGNRRVHSFSKSTFLSMLFTRIRVHLIVT